MLSAVRYGFSLVGLAGALCFSSVAGAATKHALLIGIGDYKHIAKLEAPVYDIQAVSEVVTENWGVAQRDMQILLDEEATRDGIVNALDRLVEKSEPGDWAFIYYSGHGTNAYGLHGGRSVADADYAMLPKDTAAIVPVEFNPSRATQTALVEQLVVSRWDIKPKLVELDKKGVELFFVFDSCYSQNLSRSAKPLVTGDRLTRFVPLQGGLPVGDERCDHCIDDPQVRDYQFNNAVVLYAAGSQQLAVEATRQAVANLNPDTLSNEPQGYFTESLLRAVRKLGAGASYREIYLTAKTEFDELFGAENQTPGIRPQLMQGAALLNKQLPSPAGVKPPATRPTKVQKKVRVRIETAQPALSKWVLATPLLELSQGRADYAVRVKGKEWSVRTSTGLVIASGRDDKAVEQAIQSLQGVALLRAIDNASADIDPTRLAATIQHAYCAADETPNAYAGDGINIVIGTDAAVHLLVLHVDSLGNTQTLYPHPRMAQEFEAIEAGVQLAIPQSEPIKVSAPFGRDELRLFGFNSSDDLPLIKKLSEGIDRASLSDLFERLERPEGVLKARLNLLTFEGNRPSQHWSRCNA